MEQTSNTLDPVERAPTPIERVERIAKAGLGDVSILLEIKSYIKQHGMTVELLKCVKEIEAQNAFPYSKYVADFWAMIEGSAVSALPSGERLDAIVESTAVSWAFSKIPSDENGKHASGKVVELCAQILLANDADAGIEILEGLLNDCGYSAARIRRIKCMAFDRVIEHRLTITNAYFGKWDGWEDCAYELDALSTHFEQRCWDGFYSQFAAA